MSIETKVTNHDISPLAMRSWSNCENGYMALREVAESEVQSIQDHTVREFALGCLYGRIAHDANVNDMHLSKYLHVLEPEVIDAFVDEQQACLNGRAKPDELVSLLHSRPQLTSIEIARRTHAGQWSTRPEIDYPVRTSLATLGVNTQKTKDDPRYKIRQFGDYHDGDDTSEVLAMVDRKRIVRSHFGGLVLTKLKNSLIINAADQTMPEELKEYLAEQRDQSKKRKASEDDESYNYNCVHEPLRDYIEPHMITREEGDKPTWATPLVSTYFSYIAQNGKNETN